MTAAHPVQCMTCAHFSLKSKRATLARHGFGICAVQGDPFGGRQESSAFVRECQTWHLAEDYPQRTAWARKQGYTDIDLPPAPP